MFVNAVGNNHLASKSVASAVQAMIVYEHRGEMPHVKIPRPEIDLVIRFGPEARGGLDAHALGARERVGRKVPRGVHRILIARLHLGATQAALGVPASEIAGRIVALEDLWGRAVTRRLFDRLAAARDVLEATALFEHAIAERLANGTSARATPSVVLQAANKLDGARVNAVADEVGLSDRHLRRVFREQVGLAPKAFAKIRRFQRALSAALEQEEAAGWASIALAAGYYDQAHLISEFRAIAGTTPRALLHELRTTAILA